MPLSASLSLSAYAALDTDARMARARRPLIVLFVLSLVPRKFIFVFLLIMQTLSGWGSILGPLGFHEGRYRYTIVIARSFA
ncbi:MAG: hypothetical protein BGP19_15340 [Thiobacillus sp. 0-1251]|nr:MAG: hypothetical protein ABT23_12235 [Thiobacillus sp. SCN 63-57]OJY60230.1 MAG: hypothetical protein BGP19_15340 [Thiobacillus sp. 0-1251]